MAKQEAIERAVAAAAQFGGARDLVDEAACAVIGINRAELRVLSAVVHAQSGMSAGEVAAAVALSPASTTESVQRLVARGFVVREVDPADRRRAMISAAPAGGLLIEAVYSPLRAEGARLLGQYTQAELGVIIDFLEQGRAFQIAQAERIGALDPQAAVAQGEPV